MSDSSAESVEALSQSELAPPLQTMFGSNKIEIIDWNQQVLSGGSTSGAAVTRLTGTVRVDGHEHAWSLIRKKVFAPLTKPSDPLAASVLSSLNYWKREWLLYQSGLLDQFPQGVAAPRAFHIAEEPNGYSLWTEDVQDVIGAVWPLSHYGTVAYHLGLLHAPYLTGQPLPSYPWLTRDICRQRETRVVSRDKLTELRQHPLVQRGWPHDVAEGILGIWQEREHFFRVFQQLPPVFQHGDCSRKNLFARHGQNGDFETVAIDWGFAGIGCLGEDLACLVAASALWFHAPSAHLAELDEIVFDEYVRGLRTAGWRGDAGQVRLGYTAMVALRFSLTPIVETFALTPEGQDLVEKLFVRSIEEVTDNCVFVRRFIIQRADEARQLMALLPE